LEIDRIGVPDGPRAFSKQLLVVLSFRCVNFHSKSCSITTESVMDGSVKVDGPKPEAVLQGDVTPLAGYFV
jgi:hypothetical protein